MSTHNQGTVLHPESDSRLKENQEGEPYQRDAGRQSHKNSSNDSDSGSYTRSGDSSRSNYEPSPNNQGTVLHPETDKRLKENQDGESYQRDAGRQSHKNSSNESDFSSRSGDDSSRSTGSSNRSSGSVIDNTLQDDNMQVIDSHANKKGDQTIVFQNDQT
jgi:hypothetical protein